MRDQSIRERVTVVFPGALGDLLLALPSLRALRVRHAAAHLTLVVSEPFRSLVALAGCADAVASLDGPELARVLAGGPRPPWLAPGTVVYSWLGAGDAVVRDRIAGDAAAASFFRVVRGHGAVHAAAEYARAVGVPDDISALTEAGRIHPPPSVQVDAPWAKRDRPVLVVHAGAGAPSKRWAAPGYQAVAAWWRASGRTVLQVLGPAERDDRPLVVAHVLRDGSLPELAAVLAGASLYVGNDSGVSHLAGAVGARGVVLFGDTDPDRWRPLGRLVPLRAPTGGPEGIPLDALSVERVITACRLALEGGHPERVASGSPGTSS